MCQSCENEDLEDAVNEEAKTALLAVWKAHIEAAGKGFPTDVELLDLMEGAAELALKEERERQADRAMDEDARWR